MKDNKKNQFDSLYLLWKGAWDQFNARRVYEFKTCIAVWTAFASFIALVLTGRLLQFGDSIYVILGTVICACLITISHIFWINGLGRANRLDRLIAIHYERMLQNLTDSKFDKELENTLKGPRDKMGKLIANWSHRAQIGITIVLALASIFAVIYSSKAVKLDKEKSPCCCHQSTDK
jgi:hypothetical protein